MNPGRTQTEFDRLFARLAVILAGGRLLEPVEDLFARSCVKIIEHDPKDNTTGWTLNGVIPGTNTSADGKLYVRFVADGGDWDITVYKATGGGSGDAVASANAVADGAVATLTAENSSGITGSVTLDGTVQGDTTDTHILECFVDFGSYARSIYDGQEAEDGDIRAALGAAFASAAASIRAARQTLAQLLRSAPVRGLISRVLKVDASQNFLAKSVTVDSSGAVTLDVQGLAEAIRDGMEDNTTVQKVAVTTLAAGSVTADTGNTGLGTLTVGAVAPNTPPCTVVIECVDETMPSEKFQVSALATDGKTTLRPSQLLTVGEEWNDPDLGISMTLTRTYDKNGTDGSHVDVAAVSFVTGVTGIDAENSDDGTLYGKTVANGSNWNFEFYRASGLTSADLVAKATNIATGAVFTATAQNNSGLSVAWKAGSGPTNGNTWQLDVNPFKKRRVGQSGDRFSFSITRSATGAWQEEARKQFDGTIQAVAVRTGWYFHQGASPTIPDSTLKRNSTLFPELAT